MACKTIVFNLVMPFFIIQLNAAQLQTTEQMGNNPQPQLILEKLTIQHRTSKVSGVRIYNDGRLLMYNGSQEQLDDDALWHTGIMISQEGISELIKFLDTRFVNLESHSGLTDGALIYHIDTPDSKCSLTFKNMAYDKLPPEILELEKIINSNLIQHPSE